MALNAQYNYFKKSPETPLSHRVEDKYFKIMEFEPFNCF